MTIITSLHEFRIQIITSVRAVGFLHICNGVHGYEMVFSMEGSSKLQQTVYVHKKSDIGRASLHAHHGLTFQKAISEEAFQQAPPCSNISSLTR